MTVSDLVAGETYKIKRIQSAYIARKRKVIWMEAKFVGIDGNFAEFAVDDNREIAIAIDDVGSKVKSLKENNRKKAEPREHE